MLEVKISLKLVLVSLELSVCFSNSLIIFSISNSKYEWWLIKFRSMVSMLSHLLIDSRGDLTEEVDNKSVPKYKSSCDCVYISNIDCDSCKSIATQIESVSIFISFIWGKYSYWLVWNLLNQPLKSHCLVSALLGFNILT